VSVEANSGLPIKLLHDRLLVKTDGPGGERRSSGGIVIPATATVGRRLIWAEVVGVGQNVRNIEIGDRVLYDPEERAEIEIHGASYVLLRERDVHALASQRVDHGSTGLYL
jgi:chaperonin GroES